MVTILLKYRIKTIKNVTIDAINMNPTTQIKTKLEEIFPHKSTIYSQK
jgi:hypothetical protein